MRGTGRAVVTALALALVGAGSGAGAADLDGPYGAEPGGSPRFFPRSDGEGPARRGARPGPAPVPVGCVPRRAPVPTNAPDDPSYVGSEYGLGHPSYYGFTPPLGVDDPFGRALRPYCR